MPEASIELGRHQSDVANGSQIAHVGSEESFNGKNT
jgi:hypothetical protein